MTKQKHLRVVKSNRGIEMFAKRNIAIYFGLLVALMSLCVSTAAADWGQDDLEMTVSPDNFVIGTNFKYISVILTDTVDTIGTENSANNVSTNSISLTITAKNNDGTSSSKNINTVYKTEINEAGSLVVMYEINKLFYYETPGKKGNSLDPNNLDIRDAESLDFEISGKFNNGDNLNEGYTVTSIKIIGPGGSKGRH